MTAWTRRDDYEVGEKAELSRTITAEDVQTMAVITGDNNPLHLNEDFAARTRFGGRIVHGVFATSLVSAVLGTVLPGPGTVFLRETTDFLFPARAGDTLTAQVEVMEWRPERRIATLHTKCTNQDGKEVTTGEATVLVERIECDGR